MNNYVKLATEGHAVNLSNYSRSRSISFFVLISNYAYNEVLLLFVIFAAAQGRFTNFPAPSVIKHWLGWLPRSAKKGWI